jgi:hypothetical protein
MPRCQKTGRFVASNAESGVNEAHSTVLSAPLAAALGKRKPMRGQERKPPEVVWEPLMEPDVIELDKPTLAEFVLGMTGAIIVVSLVAFLFISAIVTVARAF